MSNSKKNKNQTKLRPYAVMCTDLYLLWILMVYPLYYADGYFHLPEKKATFWCVSTIIYLGVTLFGVVIAAFSDREQWTLENIRKNISMTDIFMFGFLISNLIAFALSEDKVNAWTGASSRYYGAKVLILACLVYFVASRYAWINKIFIWAFLLGGNVVCLLATLDYFWYDVLGINQQMVEADRYVFISTMGNANTCASYVCMVVAGSIVYFCIVDGWKERIFSVVSIVNCSVGLVTARSDSPFVGVAVLYIVLGILTLKKKVKWRCVIQTAIILLGSILLFVWVRTQKLTALDYHAWYDSGVQRIICTRYDILIEGLAILVLFYVVAAFVEKKDIKLKKNTKIIIYSFFGIVALAVLFFGAVKINIVQLFKSGMGLEGEISAESRARTFQRAVSAFFHLPLLNKIFGCGQATMTYVMNEYFGKELVTEGISINSAHNHILDYLIIGGVLCVICYIGTIVSSICRTWKHMEENKLTIVGLAVVLGYVAQGFFNIEQTNTTTIFWLFIALSEAMCRQKVKNK